MWEAASQDGPYYNSLVHMSSAMPNAYMPDVYLPSMALANVERTSVVALAIESDWVARSLRKTCGSWCETLLASRRSERLLPRTRAMCNILVQDFVVCSRDEAADSHSQDRTTVRLHAGPEFKHKRTDVYIYIIIYIYMYGSTLYLDLGHGGPNLEYA